MRHEDETKDVSCGPDSPRTERRRLQQRETGGCAGDNPPDECLDHDHCAQHHDHARHDQHVGSPRQYDVDDVTSPAVDHDDRVTSHRDAAGRARAIPSTRRRPNHLYRAWRAGDRDRTALSGRPAAVNALFSLPEYPGGFRFDGCSFRDAGYDCRFEGAAEALVMRVEGGASGGWRVATVSLRS
jgi:hypothetical protein